MSQFERIDLREASTGDVYDLMTALVVPRPIAFVSTLDPSGDANVAPFSFFTLGGVNPPSLAFCPVRGKEGEKKSTLANIEANGEFVVNLVDRDMAEAMNRAAAVINPKRDKWNVAGVTPQESELVAPARIAESPAQFECRLHQVVEHGDGPGAAVYVIGEVLLAHLRPGWQDGLNLIARLGGAAYLDMENAPRFRLDRPQAPTGTVDNS